MDKKYEFTDETKEIDGRILHRIVATRDFYNKRLGTIKKGTIGGFIESEENLCHEGGSWVMNNSCVYKRAHIHGNALISGNARVCGDAWVYGDAQVYGNVWVCGDAHVCENADISSGDDYAVVSGFGSKNRTTTFFLLSNKKVLVSCGCFIGYLDEFRAKVLETHGDTPLCQEYLMIADLMEMRFKRVLESKEEE